MKKLTKDQFMGIVRHILTFVGGIFVIRGVVEEALIAEISGAIMTLTGAIWSILSKVKENNDLD